MIFFRLIICFFLFSFFSPFAQVNDSLARADSIARDKKIKKRIYSKARTASVMSAIVPGSGQIYNRKYWKAPVIYAALGGFAYMFVVNNQLYTEYRRNLIAVYDEDSSTVNKMPWYSGEDLQAQKFTYKRYRDFAVIGMGLVYLLNIVDANVDAHLKTFDVSDDLTITIDPWQGLYLKNNGYSVVTGVSIKLNLR